MNGDLNEDCRENWMKFNGVARLLIWTQAFEKDGGREFGRANYILHWAHLLGMQQLKAEKQNMPGPFFPLPSWKGSIVGGHPLDEPFFPPWHDNHALLRSA